MRSNLLIVSASFSFLLPLFVMACTSSNAASTTDGGNPAACPAVSPIGVPSCSRNADGGTFACTYPCDEGRTGSVYFTCDGSQWHVESETCAPVPRPAPTGPFECGKATCPATDACVHECCDLTPCTPVSDDGGCGEGSHAVAEGSGECGGGCIDDHPECVPTDTCQAPSSYCAAGYCTVNCD